MAAEAHKFEIEGPDEQGDVSIWIWSFDGRQRTCFNLGPADQAAEAFSQWLGSIDFQERF